MPRPSPSRPPRRRFPRVSWVAISCAAAVVACSTPAAETSASSAAASAAASSPRSVNAAAAGAPAVAQAATVTVYKSPTCGCCTNWVEHMRQHGYTVVVHDTEDVAPVKAQLGVPDELTSCHTATVGGYVLEGHVPAADVDRLLRERPAVVGLAAPGMPVGSPGMEMPGTPNDRYDVVAFERGGNSRVFASH